MGPSSRRSVEMAVFLVGRLSTRAARCLRFLGWKAIKPVTFALLPQPSCSPVQSAVLIQRRTQSTASDAEATPRTSRGDGRHGPYRKPPSEVILAPINYIRNMPTKGVLKATTAALNVWIRAPDASALTIGEVAQHIQQACLLIDDMEDNSSIRRGNPAAHAVFGHAQTLEAANFLFVQTYKQARKMRSQDAIDILLEEVENMMLGQCLDQHWKFELKPPSEEEYLNMVDNKTGAFFRLIIRLLQAETAHERAKALDFERFSTLLGRFYQIRDDLMNLRSGVYAELKGSCEDLDEGKFSYPIVHCLVNSPAHRSHIIGIFRQRPASMGGEPRPLSPQAKSHIMSCLEESGSLDAALGLVNELQADIEAETARLESAAGEQNPTLRALLKKLTLTNGIS